MKGRKYCIRLILSGMMFFPVILPGQSTVMEKPDVYLIPGMGTDYRVFRDYRLEHGNIKYIYWVDPGEVNTIEEYARLLIDQVDTSREFVLVGVSFGGMLGVEFSRQLGNPDLILVSSVKTIDELPLKYKTAKVLPFHMLLGDNMLERIGSGKFIYRDIHKPEDRELYRQMLLDAGAEFLKRQIKMIIHWKNREYDPGLFHVHGTSDQVLPARLIDNAFLITGGTHKMVINHPEKICRIIDDYLLEQYRATVAPSPGTNTGTELKMTWQSL